MFHHDGFQEGREMKHEVKMVITISAGVFVSVCVCVCVCVCVYISSHNCASAGYRVACESESSSVRTEHAVVYIYTPLSAGQIPREALVAVCVDMSHYR